MNGAQLHLALNHFPVVGSVLAVAVALAGLVFRQPAVIRTGLGIGLGVALLSIPAYLTGEPAEHFLKAFMTVTRGVIHEHEEFAEKSFILILIAGAACAFSLWAARRRPSLEARSRIVAIGLLLASTGMMAWTAHLGGLIRHEELRSVETVSAP